MNTKKKSVRRTRTFKGSIYSPANNNRIYIEYTKAATGKRVRIATGLLNNKEGQELAEKMLAQIQMQQMGLLTPNRHSEEVTTTTVTKTIQEAFKDFVKVHCANKEPKTVESYTGAYNAILKGIEKESMSNAILESAVITFVESSPLKNTSKNIYLRGLQVFVNFCVQRKYIAPQNISGTFRLNQERKVIATFSHEELQTMLVTMRENGRNDLAQLVQFLLETGFRINEALRLQWTDIEEGMMFRPSKNKKRHEPFPITNSLQKLLDSLPRHEGKPNKVFFWENTSQSALTRDFKAILHKCNIEAEGRNWHAFRKTAATRWAAQGIPIQEVQKLLGHTRVETTNSYYVGVNLEAVRKKLEVMQEKYVIENEESEELESILQSE